MGENGEWVKINLGFLRKPLQFSIHHSSFIIHHSSFSLSPLLLNSFVLHFFKPLNSYKILLLVETRSVLAAEQRNTEPIPKCVFRRNPATDSDLIRPLFLNFPESGAGLSGMGGRIERNRFREAAKDRSESDMYSWPPVDGLPIIGI